MSPLILDHEDLVGGSPSQGRTGHFVVAPATPEDIRRLVDIEFHAFENEQVNQVLSYRDYHQPKHFERTVSIYTDAMRDLLADKEPDYIKRADSPLEMDSPLASNKTFFLKVTNLEDGTTLSFAKFEAKQYTQEELMGPADAGHEDEAQMNRDWFALNELMRREYMGYAEHRYIGMLATQPQHQHHGAGTMLLDVILAEADDAGVEVYLEATDTAKPLYQKHGFVAVKELRFNPADYGVVGLGIERQTIMVRGAMGADGVRRPVRSWEEVER
nr:hypothetical protein CFP56_09168 [Quercus suber]